MPARLRGGVVLAYFPAMGAGMVGENICIYVTNYQVDEVITMLKI